jgi:hypothetical protein
VRLLRHATVSEAVGYALNLERKTPRRQRLRRARSLLDHRSGPRRDFLCGNPCITVGQSNKTVVCQMGFTLNLVPVLQFLARVPNMKSTVSTSSSYKPQAQTASVNAAWSELFAATPAGIVYNAVRELLRQRKHKRLVLQAFKR